MSDAAARALAAGELLADGSTIVALATPPGRGALALVRASGPGVQALLERLLDVPSLTPRRATRCRVRGTDGLPIDEVVATFYVAPHSFTGEDLLELSTHGGLSVPVAVVATAIAAGARQADPGEFTRRAVLNGKLDLLQAEAIGDLIDARSSAARRVALRQLDGGLSRRVAELRMQVLALEALLAYDIDFPEEDDGPIPRSRIDAATTTVIEAVTTLLATGDAGVLVHEGALVVLAGAPNVGKSSLFNALLGEARAIVTEIPGTTRDAIEAVLDLPGWPLRLVDTAGLRASTDVVERLGMEASERYLARAAVVLVCADSSATLKAVESSVRERATGEVMIVRTKSDLSERAVDFTSDVRVSAHTGVGLAELLAQVEARITGMRGALTLDAPALTSARHRAAVATAHEELQAFRHAWRTDLLPASVAAIHVRAAADALGGLIGVVEVNDVLDVVFASFCVGK